MKTESRIFPDGMSSSATKSQDGKVTRAMGACWLWHNPSAVLGNRKTISLGEALSRRPDWVVGATRVTGSPAPVAGTADPNCEASRRDGSTNPRSQESRFALATQQPSALADRDSGIDPTGAILKPNTPESRSIRRPLSMSTAAISPRALLVTKANVPSCRDEVPAGWIGGAF